LFLWHKRSPLSLLPVCLLVFLMVVSGLGMLVPAESPSSLPPLTVPAEKPNPNSNIDVFKRIDAELAEGGYLNDKQEVIEDSIYLTTKQGFDVIHLEGTPRDIGYNHARLLWEKIERGMEAYGFLTYARYSMNWDICRLQGASYWPYVPEEYRQEINGIVEGCQEMNAKNPDGNVIDRDDILAYNAMWDIWWRSSPPGNLLWWFPFANTEPIVEMPHHCSGFVAAGDATIDGGFVLSQSLWMPYYLSPSHGVFADIVPTNGNRMLIELQAGLIWSGTEFYMNEAGLVIGETTLGNGPYRWGNTPSFVRIRKAVQYANSIDEFKNIMLTDTNGAYCGDYMVCDAKNNEASIVELGSYEYEVWRSTDGYHGSCNYPWDDEVREEMGEPGGWEHGCFPRYTRLQQISDMFYGRIDTNIAKRTLGDHWDTVEEAVNPYSWTLCGHVENSSGYPHGSLDGKVANRSMTLNFEIMARFGHSCGRNFDSADHASKNPDYAYSNLIDIDAKPWTTFGFLEPITIKVVDGNGKPVEGARIGFENVADGYLAEGYTGADGTYSHPYFQTGTYNISAKSGSYRGKIRTDFNAPTTFEIALTEQTEGASLGAGTTIAIFVIGAIIIAILLVAVAMKRLKKF